MCAASSPRKMDKLDKGIEFDTPQMLKVKKLLRIICQGARLVMRTYTRVCCDKNRCKDDKKNRGVERSQELRQLSLMDFAKLGSLEDPTSGKKRKKKAKEILPLGDCEPEQGFLEETNNGALGISKWNR